MSKKTGFGSIDEYIASMPEGTQKMLREVRAIIRAAAPDVREKISYQIAGFELNGKNLIYFAGWKNHISIYPIPSGNDAFNKAISPYMDGKGTLKFPLSEPFPLDLIRKIVNLHITENLKNTRMKTNYEGKGAKK